MFENWQLPSHFMNIISINSSYSFSIRNCFLLHVLISDLVQKYEDVIYYQPIIHLAKAFVALIPFALVAENYLLALWEGGRDKELIELLRTVDFSTFTSTDNLLAIFKSLGKLQWNDVVEKFLLAFKARGMFMCWNAYYYFYRRFS